MSLFRPNRASPWSASPTITELEAIMRRDPAALGVIIVVDESAGLIDRPHFNSVLAGRLGYGRALLHRLPLRDATRGPALLLPADTTCDDAALAALARPAGIKAIPLVVDHYQSPVDADTRQVRSVEALVRWAHPDHGLLSPAAFMPQAELSDVIRPLTQAGQP